MENINTLFTEWKIQRPEYKYFCCDGILVEAEWNKSTPKILFLLKETYTHFINISGPMGPGGTSPTFWRRLKIWTYLVTEYYNKRIPDLNLCYIIKETPNDNIAYMNIKKNAERTEYRNDAYSDDNDIMKYVINDSRFLKSQIHHINPDIIFCCSTFIFLKRMFPEITQISDSVFDLNGRLIISFGHPSNRKSYVKEINHLSSILKNLM